MAGVIVDGVQYERCNCCCEFVNMDRLAYEQPSERFQYGRDLCVPCSELSSEAQDELSERESTRLARERYDYYVSLGWDVTLNADQSISIHSCGD